MSGSQKLIPVDYDPFVQDSPSVPQLIWGANQGRNGDTLLSHLTPGDVVIPSEVMNDSKVQIAIRHVLGDKFERFTAGTSSNSINPVTGLREFYDGDGPGSDYGSGGDVGVGSNGGDNGAAQGGSDNSSGQNTAPDTTNNSSAPGPSATTSADGTPQETTPSQSGPTQTGVFDQSLGGYTGTQYGPSSIGATNENPVFDQSFNANQPTQVSFDDQQTAQYSSATPGPSTSVGAGLTGIGFIDDKINSAINNPVSTIGSFALGLVPGVGTVGSILGVAHSIDSDIPSFSTGFDYLQDHGNSAPSFDNSSGGTEAGQINNETTAYPDINDPSVKDGLYRGPPIPTDAKPAGTIKNPAVTPGFVNPVHSIQDFVNQDQVDPNAWLDINKWV